MSKGVELIAAERQRQIEQEGWTAEHDSQHKDNELVMAAVCYARPYRMYNYDGTPVEWPWKPKCWKPTPDDRMRELQKAGALIAAEIDRLQALGKQP